MNNAKMWLVVKPTVGVPLFLTAVAVGSFSVHVAVLRNTTWVTKFLDGKPKGKTAALDLPEGAIPSAQATVVFKDTAAVGEAIEGTVVLPDGRTAKVVFNAPTTLASAALPTR